MRSQVQRCFSRVLACPEIHTFVQQILDHILATILTSPNETRLQLRFCSVRFQTAVIVEETLNYIEPSHTGCSFEVQSRAAAGEKLGGLWAIVGEAAVDRAIIIAGSSSVADSSSVIQQNLQEGVLHTCPLWMNARCYQADSCRSATIDVRLGVDLGAAIQQNCRDFDSVLWRLLTVTFDAISRYVV